MSIYFSHPTFTYHTETERRCLTKIRESFSDEIINPADAKIGEKTKKMIKPSNKIVLAAIESKLTFLVAKESEFAKENQINQYVVNIEDKNKVGEIKEFEEKKFDKLNRKETKDFKKQLRKGEGSLISFLIGKRSRF